MRNKIFLRKAALLLCTAMVVTAIPADVLTVEAKENGREAETAQEAEQAAEIIHIKSVEDFEKFSENCIVDAYSRGRVFSLDADLDVRGANIVPVAIFCGTFEGNGHSISGFTMKETGSDLGLIRFLEKEGIVRNLTVQGKIQPEGTGMNIGGIAGTNRGTVENCSFQGEIIAKEVAGGIVGFNEEGGRITGCQNEGKLLGTKKTGGIAGSNSGIIENCINIGGINATTETVRDAAGDDKNTMNIDFSMNFSEMSKDEERIISTGGIAGISEGIVADCTNRGAVGYPHVGYRTGGIVGYERGCIDNCQNNGKIQGRKDTGGIAGFFEPYVEINYEEGTPNQLRRQTDELIDMFSELSDITRDADSDTLENMDSVGESIDVLKDSVDNYKGYYQDSTDAFIDDMEEALDIVERRIDMLDFDVDTDAAIDAVTGMRKDIAEAKKILDELEHMKGFPDIPGGINSVSENSIGDRIETVSGGDGAGGDTGAGVTLPPNVEEILQKLGISKEELLKALIEAGWTPGSGLDGDSLKKVLESVVEEKILELAKKLGNRSEQLAYVAKDAVGEGKSLIDNVDKLGTEVKHVIHVAENHVKDFRDDMRETDADISRQMDVLDARIDVLKDRLRGANDDVLDQMDRITEQMRLINETASDGMDRLEEKLDEPAGDEELSDYYDDLSDSDDATQAKGKILNCHNTGEIISDINGGGVAGILSVDFLDSESEFEIEKYGSRSLDSKRSARGTIYNCKNTNEVTVKNDYAGGIVGRADMGAVVACQNYGNVETTDGDYAGGIAGKSDYLIRGSYALCNIAGNSYAGGIVGEGNDIKDSYAMTSIFTDEGEKFGAIAGDAGGEVAGNYFVDDGIAAVNGLTYASQAAPLTYEELVELGTTPSDFRHFTIKFMADEEEMKSIVCDYGESLKGSDIPVPPERDGILGTWDKNDFTNIRRNMIVRAVYGEWTTSLASEGDKPEVLISGQFLPNAVLTCSRLGREEVPCPGGYEVEAAYQYQIKDDSLKDKNIFHIHVLTEEYRGKICAAVVEDGKAKIIDGRQDGRYYVFEVESGTDGTVVVLTKEKNLTAIAAAAGIAVVLLLFVLICIRRKKRKAKTAQKKAGNEKKEAEKKGAGKQEGEDKEVKES